ncbi:MAG: MarR family transcriptional regulator [Myxococcaceae bacterium]|jgi:DNA-binding MarR family transcriptional regulator|nr:MarR family transcriptional regulator [Myxococcaceae bacterium]
MRPATTRRLDTLLVTRLWAFQLVFQGWLDEALARSGLGLTSAGFRLVGELMNAPMGLKQRELAQRLGVKAPTVSVAVSKLEAAGVVERVDDETDPRAWRIRLTRAAPIRPGLEVLARLDRQLSAGLSPKDRRALTALLERLTNRMTGASR